MYQGKLPMEMETHHVSIIILFCQ